MAYCGPIGLAHSDFLGWAEYDRELAREWKRREMQTCSRCGTREADHIDERGRLNHAYDVRWVTDEGCKMLERAREAKGDKAGHGEFPVLFKIDPASLPDDSWAERLGFDPTEIEGS